MSNGTTLTATMLQVSQVATRTGWFARALAAEPDLLICDEILSSLDTVVAASVLALLQRLKVRLDISFLFISQDLSTVAGMADRIFVLYSGTLVEEGWPEQVFLAPNHPYTAMLLACVPQLRQGWLEEVSLAAAGPGGPATEEACVFVARCPQRLDGVCDRAAPPRLDDGHRLFCHRNLSELDAAHASSGSVEVACGSASRSACEPSPHPPTPSARTSSSPARAEERILGSKPMGRE